MSSFLSCVIRNAYVVEDEWTDILFMYGAIIPELPQTSFGVKNTPRWEVNAQFLYFKLEEYVYYIHFMDNLNSDILIF